MEKQFSAAGQGLMRIFFGVCLSAAYVLLNTTGLLLGLMPLRVLSAITCLAVFFLVFVGLTAASVADSGAAGRPDCGQLHADFCPGSAPAADGADRACDHLPTVQPPDGGAGRGRGFQQGRDDLAAVCPVRREQYSVRLRGHVSGRQ